MLLGRGGGGREQDLLLMRGAMDGELVQSSEVVVGTAHHRIVYLFYTITILGPPVVSMQQL